MQDEARRIQAEGLDRAVESHLAAGDGVPGGGDGLGDVARVHRSVKLTGVAGLADHGDRQAFHVPGDVLGFGAAFEIRRLELGAFAFEALAVGARRAQRLARGQKVVARITVLDAHQVAHLAEFLDAFEENDLHAEASRPASRAQRTV